MRVVVNEIDSSLLKAKQEIHFFECNFNLDPKYPLVLRHEYYENIKSLKEETYIFCMNPKEHGAQVFIEYYPDYLNNSEYENSMNLYFSGGKFRINNNLFNIKSLSPRIHSSNSTNVEVFPVKDGRTRKRLLHKICGKKNAILLLYSQDNPDFSNSVFFNFVKENLKIGEL